MALTAKQERALARAPAKSRGKLRQLYQRQDRGRGSRGQGVKAGRGSADVVLAPGGGKFVTRPFGGRPSCSLAAWDAFNPLHAPLPRAVGPYAVVRTTTLFKTNKKVMMFGTHQNGFGQWSNIIGIGSVNDTLPIDAAMNSQQFGVPMPGANSGASSTLTCVPAALSVQVLNPNPLQSTSGVIAAAVCPTQLSLIDNTRTWNQFATQFVSYMKPRLLTGPKLALKGVQMNSYPMNMAALANFEPPAELADGGRTLNSSVTETSLYSTGWAPMVVNNPDGVELSYLVSVEWRVRFDISNPAVASHQHHSVTPDAVWERMIAGATALGNGVRDITEVVANMGQAASQAYGVGRAIYNASRAMPALAM